MTEDEITESPSQTSAELPQGDSVTPSQEGAEPDEVQEVENPEPVPEKEVDERPLSEENKAKIEKYGVKNPKGRAASIISFVLWSMLLALLIFKGDWSIGPILLAVLFVLLLLLTCVRFYQEWIEDGDWLDDDVIVDE